MSDDPLEGERRAASVLERALARAQRGEVRIETLMWTMAASEVVFLNDVAPQPDVFPDAPMVVERDGVSFLALFTHASFAARYIEGARVVIRGPAFEILRRLPAHAGIAVNIGAALGFEIPPDGIRAFVLDVLETEVDAR